MKELSIEEKARRYDEALERARELSTSISGAQYDTIFPELKESSDERIRKGLLYVIEHHPTLPTEEAEEYITWLEKKCEPIDKIVKRATTEKQRVLLTETNGDANIDWDTRSLQDVKLLLEYGLDYIKKLEKQGEQILANSAKTCKDEQNPAWSEEDEAMLYSAIAFVEHSAFTTIGKGKGGVVAWLKSLKDRYTWKPSVEQMDALLVKIPIENNCSKVDNILKSLYSDLKRLK